MQVAHLASRHSGRLRLTRLAASTCAHPARQRLGAISAPPQQMSQMGYAPYGEIPYGVVITSRKVASLICFGLGGLRALACSPFPLSGCRRVLPSLRQAAFPTPHRPPIRSPPIRSQATLYPSSIPASSARAARTTPSPPTWPALRPPA